jgi:hypothetical protein
MQQLRKGDFSKKSPFSFSFGIQRGRSTSRFTLAASCTQPTHSAGPRKTRSWVELSTPIETMPPGILNAHQG